jgi:hypothetical protein
VRRARHKSVGPFHLGGSRPQPARRSAPVLSQPVTVSLSLQVDDNDMHHYLDQ